MGKILIKNAKILAPAKKVQGWLLIRDRKIADFGEGLPASFSDTKIIDAKGDFVVPGFIDLHIQGAGGADVLDGNYEAINTISKTIAKFGTTGFLATTIVKVGEKNQPHLKAVCEAIEKGTDGARILGFHLEGPFINSKKKGMIQPQNIMAPDLNYLKEILEAAEGNLKMMTIAPELEGNIELIKELVKNKIIASFGHSEADYKQTLEGIKAGITHTTHIFNAMRPIHHRQPGPIPAILENVDITAQLISDGVHLHPAIIKLLSKIFTYSRICLITDSLSSAGLADGNYRYNELDYISKNGTAWYKDGTLIGTTTPLNLLLKKFVEYTGIPLEQAIKTCTINPARAIGIDTAKGSIEKGKSADLLIMNDNYNVKLTMIEGRIVLA